MFVCVCVCVCVCVSEHHFSTKIAIDMRFFAKVQKISREGLEKKNLNPAIFSAKMAEKPFFRPKFAPFLEGFR